MRIDLVRATALFVGASAALIGIGACTGQSGGGDLATGGVAGGVVAPKAAVAAPAPPGSADDGSAARADTLADLTLSSAKIRTATIAVEVKHGGSVAAQADAATSIALRVGGEVDSDDRSSGKYPTATLLLRVPPDDLPAVLSDLSHLGREKSRQLSTKDVTSQVADVSSRVDSAREAIARLRTLYAHATKVSDVIAVESELAGRQSDLEALEAQQRALAAETATAAVTVSLTSAPAAVAAPPSKPAHHRSGFIGGLDNGWAAFSHGAVWVATAVGAVLPFAVLLMVIALAARILWPRLRPVRHPVPAPAPPQ